MYALVSAPSLVHQEKTQQEAGSCRCYCQKCQDGGAFTFADFGLSCGSLAAAADSYFI